jgi:hypothetical protein
LKASADWSPAPDCSSVEGVAEHALALVAALERVDQLEQVVALVDLTAMRSPAGRAWRV